MCDFDSIGFLSSDAEKLHADIESAYPEQYALTMKVNTFCQRLQYELKFHSDNGDQVIGATLFARSVSTYQAFIILLLRGMHDQASMVLRCLLESVFYLAAISKNPGYSQKIAQADPLDYKKSRNKLKKFLQRYNPKHKDLYVIDDQIHDVSKIISDPQMRKATVADVAKDADLEDWYDVVYSSLCGHVHSSLRSLEKLLKIDNDEIESLQNHPQADDLEHLFLTGVNIMLLSIESISAILI